MSLKEKLMKNKNISHFINSKLLENRYISHLLFDISDIPDGWKKDLLLFGGVIDILGKHKFHLWDYQDEIDAVAENGFMFEFIRNGVKIHMYVPQYQTDWVQSRIVKFADFYETNELEYLRKKVIKKGGCILDIGANIGNHTVFFAKLCHAKSIYAFEPMPDVFNILCRNVEINHVDSIVKLNNIALGSQCGKAKIKFLSPGNTGVTQIEASDDGNMQLARLDDFTFERIDFVKIDVEKYEYNLLLGAKQTLKEHSPIIYIEIWGEQYRKVNNLLNSYGYRKIMELAQCNYIYKKVKIH